MTMLIFSDDWKIRSVSVAMVLLFLVYTNFFHRLTDLHLSKLIMTVLTFRDVSKFSSVNAAIYVIDLNQQLSNQAPFIVPNW